jgi:hypothetical protein
VEAPLNGLDRVGDLEDVTRGFFRVGVGARGGVFHAAALPSLSTPRATIRIASSGNGRCSALEPSVTVIEERERHQIVERFASRLEPLATRAAGA